MRRFLKYFSIAFLSQAVLQGLMWLQVPVLGFAGTLVALCFYIQPRVILFPYKGPGKKEISSFELFVVPMIIWSVAISAVACFSIWYARRGGEKIE